jgi:hypothetical protein
MKHAYFGDLDSHDGSFLWDASVNLHGHPVAVSLECPRSVTAKRLDAAAAFPQDLTRFDKLARVAIARDKECVSEYVDHHLDALTPAQLTTIFGIDRSAITREAFLAKLVLKRVWFMALDEDDELTPTFDYSIDPQLTDYVIAVKFTAKGKVESIEFES